MEPHIFVRRSLVKAHEYDAKFDNLGYITEMRSQQKNSQILGEPQYKYLCL